MPDLVGKMGNKGAANIDLAVRKAAGAGGRAPVISREFGVKRLNV